jgi:hypothetical protein
MPVAQIHLSICIRRIRAMALASVMHLKNVNVTVACARPVREDKQVLASTASGI